MRNMNPALAAYVEDTVSFYSVESDTPLGLPRVKAVHEDFH